VFTTAGGSTATYIAKWNGSAWSALSGGLNATVSALALDTSGNVYAGGSFTTCIAKWNGVAWSALAGGLNNTVYALAFDSTGNLYAGGSFTTVGIIAALRIAKYSSSNYIMNATTPSTKLYLTYSGIGSITNLLYYDDSTNSYSQVN
jgi:hypothetical protein